MNLLKKWWFWYITSFILFCFIIFLESYIGHRGSGVLTLGLLLLLTSLYIFALFVINILRIVLKNIKRGTTFFKDKYFWIWSIIFILFYLFTYFIPIGFIRLFFFPITFRQFLFFILSLFR